MDRHARITQWKHDADKIGSGLTALYLLWSTTKATIEVVRDSATIHTNASYYYLNQFTMRGLLEAVVIALRRQVDTDSRSVSLLNFLKDLKSNRSTYTLRDCIHTHLERGERTEGDPAVWEQRARYVFSCLAGEETTMEATDLITKGIKILTSIKTEMHIVADKYVAHYDREAPDVNLTMERLENHVNVTLGMANLFLPIFTGGNSDSFSHFDKAAWLTLFEQPWR